jgi:uncharacterized protein
MFTEYLAFLLAFFIGLSLGLIGGGGSILTIPILVYVMGINPIIAGAYSLFIVGITSLAGVVGKIKSNIVNYKAYLLFGLPSVLSVYLTRSIVLPLVPDVILDQGSFILSKGMAIMAFLSLIMLLSAVSILNSKNIKKRKTNGINLIFILFDGLLVGFVTGIAGTGGGFLIVPALVITLGLDMKTAVGTSLAIVATKSLIGFSGDLSIGLAVDWKFLLIFVSISIIGIFAGNKISHRSSENMLKKMFAYLLISMATFIIISEFFIK